jgi:hypothetical protein
MKLKIVLIMGLLSLGLNTNAQQEDYGETEKKHFLYDFIGDSDSLGLIDKKYVDAWWSVSDSASIIPLTRKETRGIIKAFKSGAFDDASVIKHDDVKNEAGEIIEYGMIESISVQADLPPKAYYIFVGKTKELPYKNGHFYMTDVTSVSLSNKWKKKVDAIIKKYCYNE